MKSTIKIKDLVDKAKRLGMDTLAITDDNVLHGAVEFYKACQSQGIKPIIGMNLAVDSLFNPNYTIMVTLLAKNNKGYQALIELSTKYQLSQKSLAKPDLQGWSQDLIAIIPTDNKEIQSLVNQGATEELQHFQDLFSQAYFGVNSHQDQDFTDQVKDLNLPLVALGDVRTIETDESLTLDILDHIDRGETFQVDTKKRVDYSLRSTEQMTQFFQDRNLDQALKNNQAIAQACDWQLSLESTNLPKFEVPEGHTTDSYLRELCYQGLSAYKSDYGQDYIDRMEKELEVISEMGFSDYFLIVWDLMAFAHEKGIETGFGRGSAAASLVAFSLKITGIDPLKYNLLFERFLNKERFTMPDIDLDFPDNKRHLVLEYVRNKYGDDHVAQILTFGTFGAKSSIRDILRVKDKSTQEMSRWSKAIPSQPKITLTEAYDQSKTLRQIVSESSENERLFDMAKVIEGLPKNRSTHAAGVVMAQEPLTHTVPLIEGIAGMHNTQFTMGDVEAVGLLKMDFLGLKNLTVLDRCFTYSQYEKSQGLEKGQVPLDDPKTLDLFARGDTNGVFQFESDGIKRVLKKMKPSSIEDIIATNALYRPGPMEQIDTYIKRKNGQEPVTYPHEDLKPILKLTYGIIVYQEQVMQVATQMAGYTLSEADQLRRTMSKKIQSEMDAGRQKFIQGALDNGYSQEVAQEVYDYIDRFANYGFNRAHAVAYSMLAYYLAYCKAHYPKSFFAAVLTSDWHSSAKVKVYESEIRQRQIQLLRPDINTSNTIFSVKNKGIQLGLKMIKGVGGDFASHIMDLRKSSGHFESLRDFCERIDDRYLNPSMVEPLIKAGAFDDIGPNRRSMVESLESIIESIQMSGGNISLFEVTKPRVQVIDEYSDLDLVEMERDLTGLYFSGHPMDKYKPLRTQCQIQMIADLTPGKGRRILGRISQVKKHQTNQNKPMAFIDLVDESGDLSLVVFTDQYLRFIKLLDKDNMVLVQGKVEYRKGEKQMVVDQMTLADTLLESQQVLYLKFDDLSNQENDLKEVQNLLSQPGGSVKVVVYDSASNQYRALRQAFNFNQNPKILDKIRLILGKHNCVLKWYIYFWILKDTQVN